MIRRNNIHRPVVGGSTGGEKKNIYVCIYIFYSNVWEDQMKSSRFIELYNRINCIEWVPGKTSVLDKAVS